MDEVIKTNELQRLEGVQGTDSILADTQEAGTGRLSFAQAAQFFDRELMMPGTAVERALRGKAELARHSETNLLRNWDFRCPVNRNGFREAATSGDPESTIDGWQQYGNTTKNAVRLTSEGMELVSNVDSNTRLFQVLGQEAASALAGRTLTFSVLVSELTGELDLYYSGSSGSGGWTHIANVKDVAGVLSGTFTVPDGCSRLTVMMQTGSKAGSSAVIAAAKLELGERQTLARQTQDGWELIDPPDYDLQYALCSQYSPITGEWVGSQHSNQNMLDNSYWMDKDTIVNQRGQQSYSGPYKCHGIDRWYTSGADTTVSVEEGYIRLTSAAAKHQFRQEVERGAEGCRGRTVTFSILFEHESGADHKIGIYHGKTSWTYLKVLRLGTPEGISLASVTVKVPDGAEGSLGAYVEPNGAGAIKLYAAKLELGAVQTLAHQDADGNWALNDPPPNKALELAKCQRYYVKSTVQIIAIGTNAVIFFPQTMRISPTCKVDHGKFSSATLNTAFITDLVDEDAHVVTYEADANL